MRAARTGDRPKFGVRVPPCQRIDAVADTVAMAERHGFDVAWVADSQLLWRDVYAAMALAASRTSRIVLASAVTNVETRHPSVVASAVSTISEIAPGRVLLGIGTGDSSVKPLAMKPTPLRRFEESIGVIRRLLAGETLVFGDRRSRLRDAGGVIPVHVAASGPRTLALAGRVADGVVTLAGISEQTISAARTAVESGAEAAGRELDDLEFTVGTFCHITDDIERDAAILKPVCLHMATIGGRDSLRSAGIDLEPPDSVPEVYPDMVHAEDWDLAVERAARFVTDEMAVRFAQEFCLFGTVDEILARIDKAVGLGATGFYLRHVGSYTLPTELIESFGTRVLPCYRSETEGDGR